jgi:hypothetical protein
MLPFVLFFFLLLICVNWSCYLFALLFLLFVQEYAALDSHCMLGILDSLLLENGLNTPLQTAQRCYGNEQHIANALKERGLDICWS